MVAISRIHLGGVESIVENSNLEYLGGGFFRTSLIIGEMLIVTTPKEISKIKLGKKVRGATRNEFLKIVDDYLANNKMYLTEADYKSDHFPRNIRGLLYREKCKED